MYIIRKSERTAEGWKYTLVKLQEPQVIKEAWSTQPVPPIRLRAMQAKLNTKFYLDQTTEVVKEATR